MAASASNQSSLKDPKVFLSISTGQNIANIIPILETGIPSKDTVIWLESPRAEKSGWSRPAIQILKKYGFTRQKRVSVGDGGPRSFLDAAQAVLKRIDGSVQPIFVANGGTKLHALAVYWDRSMPIIYNLDQPCAYEWFPQGIEGASVKTPYGHHKLDVDDVLLLRGMERLEYRETKCIWGRHSSPPLSTRYGRDKDYTVSLHERRFENTKKKGSPFLRKGPLSKGSADLGYEFEQAVAWRLIKFFRARSQYKKILCSVWKNVKIGRKGTRVIAIECDLLIVLKNGILIHLECKSSHAQAKDLDARLLNLQQSATQLARMAICSPCYTSYINRPWFRAHHDFKERIEQLSSFVHIPFDLPGQPSEYKMNERTFKCATFEEALEAMLGKWKLNPHT